MNLALAALAGAMPIGLEPISRRGFLPICALAACGAKSILGESARSGVEISGIETIALEDSNYGFTLVRVHTNKAIDGLGQAESPSPVIDSTIKTRGGLENLLVGEDPLQVERLWQKMYAATGLWGRRGVTIAAIGAVETALRDIAGKIVNKPVSELIWRSFATVKETAEIKNYVVPYATVYPPGNTEKNSRALHLGPSARLPGHEVRGAAWRFWPSRCQERRSAHPPGTRDYWR